MKWNWLRWGLVCVAMLAAGPGTAFAQKSVNEVLGRPAAPEGEPKSYLEEVVLFSYVEASYVWNVGQTGRGNVNELRFYDHDAGFTFNAGEFSIKKDPSERYRLGYGVVVTAGLDSQKNHTPSVSFATSTIKRLCTGIPLSSICPRPTLRTWSRWVPASL